MDTNLHYKKDHFISEDLAQEYLDLLSTLVEWRLFGPSPKSRKVYMHRSPSDIDPIIQSLIKMIEEESKGVVKGVFLNLYQDGNDYCPYHKDMYGTDVYTISLGGTRDLLIKKDKSRERALKITLRSGDMYYMSKNLHLSYKHSVPKRKNVSDKRISVVFFV